MFFNAPVVQWIEHWSPEPKIWVRLPAGVPDNLEFNLYTPTVANLRKTLFVNIAFSRPEMKLPHFEQIRIQSLLHLKAVGFLGSFFFARLLA